jgi:hypothetical protein
MSRDFKHTDIASCVLCGGAMAVKHPGLVEHNGQRWFSCAGLGCERCPFLFDSDCSPAVEDVIELYNSRGEWLPVSYPPEQPGSYLVRNSFDGFHARCWVCEFDGNEWLPIFDFGEIVMWMQPFFRPRPSSIQPKFYTGQST